MTVREIIEQAGPSVVLLIGALVVLGLELRRQHRAKHWADRYRHRLVYRDARTAQDVAWRIYLAREDRP